MEKTGGVIAGMENIGPRILRFPSVASSNWERETNMPYDSKNRYLTLVKNNWRHFFYEWWCDIGIQRNT